MSTVKNNNIFEKTSFLGGNSSFIKELYLKYLNNPKSIPRSWVEFFDGLDEDQEVIKKEILGPSWVSRKGDNIKTNLLEKDLVEDKQESIGDTSILKDNYEKEKEQSVKAIAMIRAYRIRGHLIANLDPLEMMERKYLDELHPADHGFKKEDYNKKIYLGEYMDRNYATVDEIISFLKTTYCSTIGAEYMHIADPTEKTWFRVRMEKEENQIKFTSNNSLNQSTILHEAMQTTITNI